MKRWNGGWSAPAEGQLIEGCYLGCGHSSGFNLPISAPKSWTAAQIYLSRMQTVPTNQNISPRRPQLMRCGITSSHISSFHRRIWRLALDKDIGESRIIHSLQNVNFSDNLFGSFSLSKWSRVFDKVSHSACQHIYMFALGSLKKVRDFIRTVSQRGMWMFFSPESFPHIDAMNLHAVELPCNSNLKWGWC